MPSKKFQKHLPYSADELITFVSDVESYTSFLNMVSAIQIIGDRIPTARGEKFKAKMKVSYKFISENVRCTVNVDRRGKTVVVRKAGDTGAVKELVNDWRFYTLSDGTTLLDFYVNVTLRPRPLDFLARQKFDDISEKVMGVFIIRAAQVCTKVDSDKDMSAEIAALGAEQLV